MAKLTKDDMRKFLCLLIKKHTDADCMDEPSKTPPGTIWINWEDTTIDYHSIADELYHRVYDDQQPE
jgi:hypothetical protein